MGFGRCSRLSFSLVAFRSLFRKQGDETPHALQIYELQLVFEIFRVDTGHSSGSE